MSRPRRVVLKLSGKVLDDAAALRSVAQDAARIHAAGVQLVVVHGGGKQLDRLCTRLGLAQRIIEGRRITDAATLTAAKMSFAGELLTEMLAQFAAAGLRPVGLHGPACVRARRRPPLKLASKAQPIDFGFVGDITALDTKLLQILLEAGYVPILAPLAGDERGEIYNVNADTIAAQLSAELAVDTALMLSDVCGVLRDVGDPTSLIEEIDTRRLTQLVAEGVVRDGMLPKLAAAARMIERGVGSVWIASGFVPRVLSQALGLSPGLAGTRLF